MSRWLVRKSTAKKYQIEDDDLFVENPMGLVDIEPQPNMPAELKPLPEDGKFLAYASAPIVAPKKIVYIPADDLPEPWTWTQDSKGRIYYVNVNTGATQWGRPGLEDEELRQQERELNQQMHQLESQVVQQKQRAREEKQDPGAGTWQRQAMESAQLQSKQQQQQQQQQPQQSIQPLPSDTAPRQTIARGTITARARPKAFTLLRQEQTCAPSQSIYSPPVINEDEEEDAPPPPPPGIPPASNMIMTTTKDVGNVSHSTNTPPRLSVHQQYSLVSPNTTIPAPPPSPPISPDQPVVSLFNSTSSSSLNLPQQSSNPYATNQSQSQYRSPSSSAATPTAGGATSGKFGSLFGKNRASNTPVVAGASSPTPTPTTFGTASSTTPTMKPLSLAEMQRSRQTLAGASQPKTNTTTASSPTSTATTLSMPPPPETITSMPPQPETLTLSMLPPVYFDDDDDDDPPPPPPPPPPE